MLRGGGIPVGPTTAIGSNVSGGFYAGKVTIGANKYYIMLGPSTTQNYLAWSTINQSVASTSLVDGFSNTTTRLNSATYPAAQYCTSLATGGYTDWYLPARDELEICYRNLKPGTGQNLTTPRPNTTQAPNGGGGNHGQNSNSFPTGAAYTTTNPAQTTVSAMQTGQPNALIVSPVDEYWTSTDGNGSYGSWVQSVGTGGQNVVNRTSSKRTVAVRRVLVV